MGHVVESEPKAQMGLGTTVLYISPVDSWPALRKNQGIQKAFTIREAQWVDIWAVLETH